MPVSADLDPAGVGSPPPGAADAVPAAIDPAAILARLPQAVAVVDSNCAVVWENGRLAEVLNLDAADFAPLGRDFYDLCGATHREADLLRSGGCPIAGVLAGRARPCGVGESAENVLEVNDRFLALTATPLTARAAVGGANGATADAVAVNADGCPAAGQAVVLVRDVTSEVRQRQKLDAIRRAGEELGDLMPEELPDMTAEDRVELLRGKVLQFTRDLMEFDTVEIRLLDDLTGELRSLLSSGMGEGVAELPLRAAPEFNGATGLVAATGKPYLCQDTACDPHYLPGAPGARSALTVPLVLGEQILGTFNVESREPAAFTEDDVRFAELFAREIAAALHTLELLVAEKYSTARESTERTLREVAGPLDEILRDSAWLLEKYIGHGREMSDRLKRVLTRSREIKSLIHRVGEELRPEPTRSPLPDGPVRPTLKGARVLVADADARVRSAAHALLGRAGCEVETAHNVGEALMMARSFPYDAALVDVRLPPGNEDDGDEPAPPAQVADKAADAAQAADRAADGPPAEDALPAEVPAGGYDCFRALREHAPGLPVIFMTGFGYDPGHSIVRARREGLHGVLYKPFRPDQLMSELETAVA
ncbi:response regulator [Alienimonas californiensis]|uniref:Response regulator FixJ n=1 Tax=Alienimonas californiensis TaxID=2527989 RepID=A0A517P7U3_9PLAN|nr:GAF domain-containing protein [Alienimonas californiensis]QDT15441.1 response regulator FixJ [Alienimonas californiensis]